VCYTLSASSIELYLIAYFLLWVLECSNKICVFKYVKNLEIPISFALRLFSFAIGFLHGSYIFLS
jgi:hypothetical protein